MRWVIWSLIYLMVSLMLSFVVGGLLALTKEDRIENEYDGTEL